MKYSLIIVSIILQLVSVNVFSQQSEKNNDISKAIEKYGNQFLKNKNISSVSIGIYKDGNIYTKHLGEIIKGEGNPPTDDTIYEVGSVSKTLTGYLVAKAVLEGKLKLDEAITTYLTGDYSNLQYNGNPIKIKHLLTHTGGLPTFLPLELNDTFTTLDETVPAKYHQLEKSYSREKFLVDLKNVTITTEPGGNYAYSNAGAELTGYILEKIYQKSIDELIREYLQLENTVIQLNDTQAQKVVSGYWMDGNTQSPLQANPLWGTAGGMKMNILDMLQYCKLQLDSDNPIVEESHKVLHKKNAAQQVAYFWQVWNDKNGRSYNHHGGTTGTQNWLYIFPKYNLGISIITNQSGPATPNLLNKTATKILKSIVK